MLDRDTVSHEAAHCAAALLQGLTVTAVDCIGNGKTFAGQIKHIQTDDWRAVATTLMVAGVPPGWPPNASRSNDTASAYNDVAHLRQILDEKRIDQNRYYALKCDAEELTSTPAFLSLKARIEDALLSNGGRLGEADIVAITNRWRWDQGGQHGSDD